MMAGLQKVTAGQSYDGFPASTYNAIIEVINAYRAGQLTFQRQSFDTSRSSGIIEVLNSTITSRNRMDVMGIGNPIILPTDDADEWEARPRVQGVSVTTEHEPDRFVVLLEPAKLSDVVWCVAAGVANVRINVSEPEHLFAGCKANIASNLVSRAFGGARILWKEAGYGIKKAIVRLGPPPAIGIVEIVGTSCEETDRDYRCVWDANLVTAQISGSSLCSPFIVTDAVWAISAHVCEHDELPSLRGGERFIAVSAGNFSNSGVVRPLYILRNPDIGKVRVNKFDELNWLENQYRDHVGTGTYVTGDVLVKSQTDVVGVDQVVRRFVDMAGYSASQQAFTHPASSSTPTWLDVLEMTVITDLRINTGGELQKRTSTIKVLSNVDDGWSTALPTTSCP